MSYDPSDDIEIARGENSLRTGRRETRALAEAALLMNNRAAIVEDDLLTMLVRRAKDSVMHKLEISPAVIAELRKRLYGRARSQFPSLSHLETADLAERALDHVLKVRNDNLRKDESVANSLIRFFEEGMRQAS